MASVMTLFRPSVKGLLLVMAVLSAGCSRKSERDLLSIKEVVSPVPAPARVSTMWTNYVKLLRQCEGQGAISNQPTAVAIIDVVSTALTASAASPLLDSDSISSLPHVFAFGQTVVSNLLNASSHTQEDFSKMADVFAWLVRGLRNEPDVTSWRSAIALEEKLLDVHEWRLEDRKAQRDILARTIGHDYVSNTIDFVEASIASLEAVRLHGKHDDEAGKTIQGIVRTLNKMRNDLKNHARLKEQALGLHAMVLSRPASAKKEMITAFLDLLLAEIVLEERKNVALRIEDGYLGGSGSEVLEIRLNGSEERKRPVEHPLCK